LVELSRQLKEYADKRANRCMDDSNQQEGFVRLESVLIDNVRTEVSYRHFKWTNDGSKERGGTDLGPSPLATFIGSLAACQETHYAEYAANMGIKLDSLKMRLDAKYDSKIGGAFNEISYETYIESPSPSYIIKQLVEKAELDSLVTQTLKKAVVLFAKIYHNGKLIMERSYGGREREREEAAKPELFVQQ
jgi:uncharacterized OsmC-like protein